MGCSDPHKCEQICESKGGCTNIAFILLVLDLMPTGLRGLMLAVMMAALMSACSLINAGAGTEEVSNKFSTITKFQPIAWESYFCW